jgi:histidinol phosphatase-like PHP family hydrolase
MEKVLVNKQTEDLVRGEYSAVEAKEIVSNLISQKINFHNLRDFSYRERFGNADENSLKRIVELKESRKSMLEIIDVAKEEGKAVKINSNITIELI